MSRRAVHRIVGAGALVLAVTVPTGAVRGGVDVLPLHHQPVALHPEDGTVDTVGRLRYRGGLDITSDDRRFGGLSGLAVGGDGTTLVAVGDSGHWITARLRYDAGGFIVGIGDGRIGPLIGVSGRPLAGKSWQDAESIARDGTAFVVAFERRHRLLAYPVDGAGRPFRLRPRRLKAPPGLAGAPDNGGIEALTAIGRGRFYAATERFETASGGYHAWTGRPGDWRAAEYERVGRFRPSGATTLPGGDILVLERRFNWIGGLATRIVRLHRRRAWQRTVVALLEPPLTIENFEGISVARPPGGPLLVYLVSDDNFSVLGRTVLMVFALGE